MTPRTERARLLMERARESEVIACAMGKIARIDARLAEFELESEPVRAVGEYTWQNLPPGYDGRRFREACKRAQASDDKRVRQTEAHHWIAERSLFDEERPRPRPSPKRKVEAAPAPFTLLRAVLGDDARPLRLAESNPSEARRTPVMK